MEQPSPHNKLPIELLNNISLLQHKFPPLSINIYKTFFTTDIALHYNNYLKYIDYLLSLSSYTLSTPHSTIDNSFHSIILPILLTLINDHPPSNNTNLLFNKLISFCFSLSSNGIITFDCVSNIYLTLLSTALDHLLTLYTQHKSLHVQSFTPLKTLIESITLNTTNNIIEYDSLFIGDIVKLLQSKLFKVFEIKMQLHRNNFFLYLLNIHMRNDLYCEDTQHLIFEFLCDVYKFNLKGQLYHTVLYHYSYKSTTFLMNTLTLINKLLKCENTLRSSNDSVFRRGFIVSHNNSLIHNGIIFNKRVDSYMFVFGFNLMSTTQTKTKQVKILSLRHKSKDKEKVLLELYTEGEKGLLHLIHNDATPHNMKYYINRNCNYIFVLEVLRNKRCKIWTIKSPEAEYCIEELSRFSVPLTPNEEMKLELGGTNFNGIFSDVLILKTENDSFFTKQKQSITVKDIAILKDEYFRIADNILSYKLVNEESYTFEKRTMEYLQIVQRFRDTPNECVYHLSVESLGMKDLIEHPLHHLYRSVEDTSIEIFDHRMTCFEFLHNNGVDFLMFALHLMNTQIHNDNAVVDVGEFVLIVLQVVQNVIEVIGVEVLLREEINAKVFFFELVRFMRKANMVFTDEIVETLCFVVNVAISDDVGVCGKEVGQMLMENCFCVSCLSEKISNESVDQMLSIMNTSIKRYPMCFQNEQILQQILSFDNVVDKGTTNQTALYRSLLLSCLRNNNDVLDRFYKFVIEDMDKSNEVKMCFYIRLIYANFINKDVITQIKKVPSLLMFYNNFLKKSIDSISPGHCRECDLMFCYLFIMIKHFIHYGVNSVNNNNNTNNVVYGDDDNIDNDDNVYELPLLKLMEKKSVIISPTLTFIKAVIASMMYNCSNEAKCEFIENNKDTPTNNDNGVLCYDKSFYNVLNLNNQFLIESSSSSSSTIDQRRCLSNAFDDLFSYLEFVIEGHSDNYITSIGNNAVCVYRDLLITAFDENANLPDGSSFYINDVFVTAFPRFFGFYCKHNANDAVLYIENVIERCLTCITRDTFYNELTRITLELTDVNVVCNIINILIDTAVKICNNNLNAVNRKEVLTSIHILITIYNVVMCYTNRTALLNAIETKVMLFLVSIQSLVISKHWFSINGIEGCKTIYEMVFDLYMMSYNHCKLEGDKLKYQMLLQKLLICDSMMDSNDEDESVFYRMERDVLERKALLKTRTKKGALNETPFTNLKDLQRQKEKMKFLDEISSECGYCMVVYFLGKLMYVQAEYEGEEKFVEELVKVFVKDALRAKGVNRKFVDNFIMEDNSDKGVLKRVYMMLMGFFKEKADGEVSEEDVERYYKEIIAVRIREGECKEGNKQHGSNNNNAMGESQFTVGSGKFKHVRSKLRKATVTVVSNNIKVNIGGLQLFSNNNKVDEFEESEAIMQFGDNDNEGKGITHKQHSIRKERAMSFQQVQSRLGKQLTDEEASSGYMLLYSNELTKEELQLQTGTNNVRSNSNNNDNNVHCGGDGDNNGNRNRVINELQKKYSLQAEEGVNNDNGRNTIHNNSNHSNESIKHESTVKEDDVCVINTNDNDNNENDVAPINETNADNNKKNNNTEYKQEQLMKYFNLLFNNSEKETTSLLFNPRHYFIWRTFAFILRKHLFHNQTFLQLSYHYDRIYHSMLEPSTLTYSFALPYPTKLMNFVTFEYTKPFLKPDLNFFSRSSYSITHNYFSSPNPTLTPLQTLTSSFTSIIPEVTSPKTTFECELVTNQGYYYGALEMNEHIMLFRSSLRDEDHLKSETNIERKMEFVFASQDLDRIKTRNKNVLIYLDEIEEVIQRRFALMWIGFEIFLKDKRSYLFNFYTQEKYSQFADEISTIHYKRRLNILIVTDSKSQFKKYNYKYKYARDRLISSYQYLLYMNKYTGRSYNDVFQYPIMPWMIVNLSTKSERYLGKAMSLQKMHTVEMMLQSEKKENAVDDNVVVNETAITDNNNGSDNVTTTTNTCNVVTTNKNDNINILEERLEEMKYKLDNNIESLGYHFNLHYSTNGALYFYLSRMNPFTQSLIKFQSGTFDAPSRMFFSINELLHTFESSEENRELIPEFFYNYHFLLNLNKNNLGYFREKQFQIGNVTCDTYINPIHFIVHQRELLDLSTKVPEWIDIIFGINQFNKSVHNSFSPDSYAALNNYMTKIKEMRAEGKNDLEIFKSIRDSLTLLSLGITPHRLFKKVHPTYAKFMVNTPMPKHDIKDMITTPNGVVFDRNDIDYTKIDKCINECSILYDVKYVDMSFVIKSQGKLNVFELDPKGKKVHLKDEIIFDEHNVHYTPEHCAYCEVTQYPKMFAFVRYNDNTLRLFAKQRKNLFYLKSYKWPCFISAIARKRNGVVFITDEYGYLSELEVEMDGKDVTKVYMYVKQKVHCHDALIRGMVYDERLSIVVTFDIDGVVCLNNAHSLSLICVIEPNVKMIQCNGKVVDVKINKRDFIYVVYTNGIIAYTLGGMKISEYINEHHIIKGIEIDYDENIIINEGNTIKSVCMWNLQSTLHEESFNNETEITNVYVLRNIKSKWYVCSNGKVLKRKYD